MKNCLIIYLLLALRLYAVEWDVKRIEGRDYLSLNQVAEFYGFPQIPSLPAEFLSDSNTASPGLPSVVSGTAPQKVEIFPDGKKVWLTSGDQQMEVTLKSRLIQINGINHWMGFPILLQEGKLMISRLDLAKTIEPSLRPHLIPDIEAIKTVVLDAGHGGHDKGAACRYGREKDFTLDVCLRLKKLLEAQGIHVVMTRTKDVFIPLEERARIANRHKSAIFVSIHFNATDTNPFASGFEIFSLTPRGAPSTADEKLSSRDLRSETGNPVDVISSVLASSIYHSVLGNIPQVDRGHKNARFAVLRLTKIPSVLVECGFISNNHEAKLISSPAWRGKLAEAIAEGIGGYKYLTDHKMPYKFVAEFREENRSNVTLRNDTSLPLSPQSSETQN